MRWGGLLKESLGAKNTVNCSKAIYDSSLEETSKMVRPFLYKI